MPKQQIVKFGLQNVHYALYNESEGTYGTPKEMPGGVSLSLSPEGDSNTFYADNTAFFQQFTNSGYSGSLEIAFADDEVMCDLLGLKKDANSMVIEMTDAVAPSFALMYEVATNTKDQRFVMYNCVLSRPETEANTKSESIDPDTQTFNFNATGREMEVTIGDDTVKKYVCRGSLMDSDTNEAAHAAYLTFMDAVPLPGTIAAA